MSFKKGFTWGVATAAYQIEGAWNKDGKGLSIWDIFSHDPNRIAEGHTGNVACDHYHKFREDVHLMKELGIKAYRFSICWTRIFPNGVGEINEKGIKFYSDLIDALLECGIEPYITLFHWDYPYALHKKGGWLNDDSVQWFADYAAKIVELYSDRVTNFITFNEPQTFLGAGYITGDHAPGLKATKRELFQICHNVLKAHGAAVLGMRAAAKQPIRIGFAAAGPALFPAEETPENIEAVRQRFFRCPSLRSGNVMWSASWWSDPIIFGCYPEDGLELYKDHLPVITEEDMKLISQPIDFYGQNVYNGKAMTVDAQGKAVPVAPKAGYTKTAFQWPVTPQALYWSPRFLYERYKKPILILENGMSAHDTVSLDGRVHDPNRIDFLHRYLLALEQAAKEGIDIDGYFLWSFMDNFEWSQGYAERFGIVYVDYETQARIPKDSAYWYRSWIEDHSN